VPDFSINRLKGELNMFKFLSKSSYDELMKLYSEALKASYIWQEKYQILEKEINDKLSKLQEELNQKEQELENLKDLLRETDENSVTLKVSNDLTKVVPIVRYNPSTVEKFIELGYLSDDQERNTFAAQLALLTIVQEAVSQILENFTDEVKS
jgi:flagellar motility protein MotE (MotC chaperone)